MPGEGTREGDYFRGEQRRLWTRPSAGAQGSASPPRDSGHTWGFPAPPGLTPAGPATPAGAQAAALRGTRRCSSELCISPTRVQVLAAFAGPVAFACRRVQVLLDPDVR